MTAADGFHFHHIGVFFQILFDVAIIPLIVGIGVFTCILPYVFYTLGLRDVPAGTATALGIIEPLSATVFSVAFLGEKLTAPLIIGMVLILAAVFALAKQK